MRGMEILPGEGVASAKVGESRDVVEAESARVRRRGIRVPPPGEGTLVDITGAAPWAGKAAPAVRRDI